MKRFAGRRVLVTGAAAGLGCSLARAFAREGAAVVLTDRDVDGLERTRQDLAAAGFPVTTYRVDVSDREAVLALAVDVLAREGFVDVLVNNAGIGYTGRLDSTSRETWERLVAVDLWGPMHHVEAFLPSMKERRTGQIVNVSSGQVFFRLPTWGAYAAVKAGLATWSETLHWELRPYGIAVTTVYPFLVRTRFYDDSRGETAGARWSLKVLPWFAQEPDTVARVTVRAVAARKRAEHVHPVNLLGRILQATPPAALVFNRVATGVLAGGAP